MLWEGTDWVHLAQGKDKWRTLENTVITILDYLKKH